MATRPEADALIDTISDLALDLAQHCPDCADKAVRLASLVRQLRTSPLERGAIKDALDSEALGTDMSDLQVRSAAEAVARTASDDV